MSSSHLVDHASNLLIFKSGSHMIPSPKSHVTRGQIVQSQPWRAWKLGLTTSPDVPSPKYDMDAYTTPLVGGEALPRFMLRVGSSQKLDLTLNT